MVDYVYYGRGDRANVRLGDEQVRAIIESRSRSRTDVVAELRRMADDDPITENERQLGHLYLLAQPETASEEMLLDLLARNDTVQVLQEIIREIARNRGSGTTGFEPDIHWLQHRIPRAEGMAIASYSTEDGPPREQGLLELVKMAGSGSSADGGPTHFAGQGSCLMEDRRWSSSPCSCWA